jgi:DNA topoisomerase-2
MTPITKFGSTCELPNYFIKKIIDKLGINEIVEQHIQQMENMVLTKLNVGKKKSIVKGIAKLYDANYAGTKRSGECTIIFTEGDSAKTMAISGLSAIPNGNNFYGVFPLKGKLLNVREATNKQIINNEEFKNIQQILGLKVNKHYTQDNLSELRYGNIILMMDADVDGSHIKGLFINMLNYFWPSLMKIDGFVKIFITPIVKATSGKITHSFYTLSDYNNWKNSVKSDKWEVKYYKGLGTNTPAEAKEYFKNLQHSLVDLNWEGDCDEAIELAFSKEKADDRKEWLKDYDIDKVVDYSKKKLSYYNFINRELIHFSNYDNIRSIPSLLDGLKPSQRKVLFASFKKNLNYDIKVAQFVGYVAEVSSYHHGEVSLANTIVGMAQNFVGSNNINLLAPNGQFGTRLQGGKDHSSPRYIYTQLEKVSRLIYHKDDDELLNYLDDDGFEIEPEYYVPIIPMVLVNGSEGIGTGYSTYIPKFNPIDIINSIKNKIKGEKFKEIQPWYANFNGNITKVEKNIYNTRGRYTINKNQLIITELPIGMWTENYKIYLETELGDGKLFFVKSIKNNSTESTVNFTIKIKDQEKIQNNNDEIEKLFMLNNKINMHNMYLHDKKGKIKKYNKVTEILEEFYVIRLDFYQKRKDHILKKIELELKILNSKLKFVGMVVGKKIKLLNIPKNDVIKILEKEKLYKIPNEPIFDYLIKIPFYSFTKEKIDELEKIIYEKNKLHKLIKNKKITDLWLDDLNELLKYLS